jgi:uncharacterized protein (DUF1330 family)
MIIVATIADRDQFISGYASEAAKLVAKFGGRYLLRAPGAALLEGDFGEGASVVISEWPDRTAALRFWNSSDYQEVKKLRAGIAKCQVLLADGPPVAG